MSATDQSDPAATFQSTRIVVGALALGVVLFAAIAAFAGPIADPPASVALGLDAVALAAIAVTLSAVPLSFILPARAMENVRSEAPERRLQAFRTSRVLGAALCEGPALLWCVAMLLSGNRRYLAPTAILVALLLLHLPTRESFEAATGERGQPG